MNKKKRPTKRITRRDKLSPIDNFEAKLVVKDPEPACLLATTSRRHGGGRGRMWTYPLHRSSVMHIGLLRFGFLRPSGCYPLGLALFASRALARERPARAPLRGCGASTSCPSRPRIFTLEEQVALLTAENEKMAKKINGVSFALNGY